MSMRGLVVALLCGVLGLGLGAVVAYAARPTASPSNQAYPMSGSPSIPTDLPTAKPPAPDISFPVLDPNLGLPLPARTIGNDVATWTYHVPADWKAYAVCPPCQPPLITDSPLTPHQAARQVQVRYRPPGEPSVGGYSLRVEALDNSSFNTAQMVATKIVGFRQAYADFAILHKTPSSVYFTYYTTSNHLRYNYFQWFAAPGSSAATLEMSVAGRERDVPGLKALFNRFADNVLGTDSPYHPGKAPQRSGQSG